MRNDQILSGINEISEGTSRKPVYSMSDPLFGKNRLFLFGKTSFG